MEVDRLFRPALSCSASLVFIASAMAAGPARNSDCCEIHGGACTSTLDECDGGGACNSAACAKNGCQCRNGQPCRCGGACGLDRGAHGSDDGVSRWSDEWYEIHGHYPIGSPQKYHAGKLWPPYPRPQKTAQCSSHFHANIFWPHPYNCWDRGWVKTALATQTANGWAQATTLCAYHFDAETHRLNESGRIHLRWILEHAPPEQRTVYVQSSPQSHVSDARHAAVQNESTLIAGPGAAQIVVQPVQVSGRPANEVDSIRRTELQTMPQPRIAVQGLGKSSSDSK